MRSWAACTLPAVMVLSTWTGDLYAQGTPASQPAGTSGAPVAPGVPIDVVRKAFDKALQTAAVAGRRDSLAGNTQALAEYRKAQNLANRYPDLAVHREVTDDIARKITDLQGKISQQAKARQAAESARHQRSAASSGSGGARGGSPVVYGGRSGGSFGVRTSRGGGVVRISRGGGVARIGAACPPGAVRTGST